MENNITYTGEGNVVLLAGGGKIFTDIAARFVRSERSLQMIAASEYDKNIVLNILQSGHLAATEFDYFIFGIEGFSRVTEVQLVRKRLASYLIKSGRIDKHGKRTLDYVLPKTITEFCAPVRLMSGVMMNIDAYDILDIVNQWYDHGVQVAGLPEEDLRYIRPQGTAIKAIIGMNAHALLDWFQIRTCKKAQYEIRDLACKMMNLCKDAAPDLFANAGPSCASLGYCPENGLQHDNCKEKILTKNKALEILREATRQKTLEERLLSL